MTDNQEVILAIIDHQPARKVIQLSYIDSISLTVNPGSPLLALTSREREEPGTVVLTQQELTNLIDTLFDIRSAIKLSQLAP